MARYYNPGPPCGIRLGAHHFAALDVDRFRRSCDEAFGATLAAQLDDLLGGSPLDRIHPNALERFRRVALDQEEIDLAIAIGAYLDHLNY